MSRETSFRDRLLACLGGEWPDPCALDAAHEETVERDGYRIERVSWQVEPDERVPAFVLVPDGVTRDNPAAGIAVWHQHGGQFHLGKSEPAGLAGDPTHHTGVALAREGYVVLCPDAICFEERRDERLQAGNCERFMFLKYVVEGKCLAWKNILDMRRAVDYLASRPDVRADALGCYGHSLGSTMAWLVGPWEPRLKCLVANCCLPTYDAIHRVHMLHSYSNFIPGLRRYGDTPDVAALIAPRALHMNFGAEDSGSPLPEVREAMKTIEAAYAARGATENFSWFVEEGKGHVLSEAMWQRTREKFLKHVPQR